MDSSWDESTTLRFTSSVISRFPEAVIAWDEGDEDWIQVLCPETMCYVHINRPFVMAIRWAADDLSELAGKDVVVLRVDSWDARCFSADVNLLRRAFPGYILPDALPTRTAEEFSAEDLWFATD
ncbi:hypothetical protein Msi02_14620 [Microbispora siamensis]|uniref:DUF2750 domain-containing protein n=1 Tax=Microbispora siamensis TaxID=564413 RepID=A0ABQ4GGU6_9ACTN|nr:hypothetical protein [Microbispora sp. GKU 823]GIH60645.1 hypothetical protein Msi02_14620 [Microbispora siamensis]